MNHCICKLYRTDKKKNQLTVNICVYTLHYSSAKKDFNTENAAVRPVICRTPLLLSLHFAQCCDVSCHCSTHVLQPIMLLQHSENTGSSMMSAKVNQISETVIHLC